jgi:hypothetical protein
VSIDGKTAYSMKRLENLVEILARLFPPKSRGRRRCALFGAFVVPLSDNDQESGEAIWVTVYSVTHSEVHLLHAEPLVGRRLKLSVTVASGEVLRIIVSVHARSRQGELYKTVARFLSPRPPPPRRTALSSLASANAAS